MLLWPHPLIPEDDFIDGHHDEKLVQGARFRLNQFRFVALLENPQFVPNLRNWLERPIILRNLNETDSIPEALKKPMTHELDSETLGLIESRSRLDLKLWSRMGCAPDASSRFVRSKE